MPGRKMGAFAEGDQRATKRLIDRWVKGLAIRLRMLLESVARVFRIRVRGGHDAPAMMPIIETYREHIAALLRPVTKERRPIELRFPVARLRTQD